MEKIFQVSEFNEFISVYLKQAGEVTVEGEISELKSYQDKWLYITLKDESANLSVFAVTFNISGWHSLSVGMKVQATGTPSLHQKSGKFSFNATRILPAGEGALKLAYEKLRLQLEKDGLFDLSRKRPIPQFPKKVGLVTALGSDAYNDFIKVLAARFGGIKISFFPVQVQGRDAPSSILAAFTYFNSRAADFDALILTRGGGSLEDLQAFNDEQVVRAIFASKIPVICGVGHEKDISLCDLAADLRASTPSNAAELLVRHRDEYINRVTNAQRHLLHYIEVVLTDKSHRLLTLVSSLEKASRQPRLSIQSLQDRLTSLVDQMLLVRKTDADSLARLLKSLDYHQTLKRGFSITHSADGQIISSVKQVRTGDFTTIQLADGKINSTVTAIHHETT